MRSGRRDLGQVQADEMYVRSQGGGSGWRPRCVCLRGCSCRGRWLYNRVNTYLHE